MSDPLPSSSETASNPSARRIGEHSLRFDPLLDSVIASLPSGLSVFDAQHQLVLSNPLFGHLLRLPDGMMVSMPDFGVAASSKALNKVR